MTDQSVDIPDFNVFKNDINRIYPEGDLVKAYERMKFFIMYEKYCLDGKPITYKLIIDKYRAHINLWNIRYARKEKEGYLSKEAEKQRLDIFDFIGLKYYEREFIIPNENIERDHYLFGNFTIEYLLEQLKHFKLLVNGKTKKEKGNSSI